LHDTNGSPTTSDIIAGISNLMVFMVFIAARIKKRRRNVPLYYYYVQILLLLCGEKFFSKKIPCVRDVAMLCPLYLFTRFCSIISISRLNIFV
jgi:hypothetical protein